MKLPQNISSLTFLVFALGALAGCSSKGGGLTTTQLPTTAERIAKVQSNPRIPPDMKQKLISEINSSPSASAPAGK